MSKIELDDFQNMPPDPRMGGLTVQQRHELRELVLECKSRQIEALRLYDPLPFQDAYHRCTAKESIMQKATQAGGSVAGFAEVARAVTNQDPYHKYPKHGLAVCLGYGEGHIGRVIHRYLFRWGAFSIIRDLATNDWRTFRPWHTDVEFQGKFGDKGRERESRPAPPLIPRRFIDGKIAWLKRSQHIFSYVKFITGWELYAFNSQGEPSMAQGFQCDLYDIDEDVARGGWYEEAVSRTSIRNGLIRWHAVPHAKTDDIVQMIQRADNEAGNSDPTTVCIRATMYDNPYYPEEAKRHNEKIWHSLGEDVYRKRALGELTLDTFRMYPMFTEHIHKAINRLSGIEQELENQGKPQRALVQKVLAETNGEPPLDWARYMIFDPGYTVGAVLFFCVPPPATYGNFRICYDELYIMGCTANVFGQRVIEKTRNRSFQDFIIDAHGGRLRELGTGILPRRQYEKEMETLGIVCEARGPRFLDGSDDIEGREMAFRRWLEVRHSDNPYESGYPTFLVNVERCPNTCREIKGFRKLMTRVGGREVVTDKGNRRAGVHCVEVCEYGAAHGLAYVVPPRKVVIVKSLADQIREGRRRRDLRRRLRQSNFQERNINLGPQGDGG
jgi:hypothetical protein